MIALLVLALVLDVLITGLVDRNAQTGALNVPLVWLFSLFQFIWMLGAIGVVWLMISGGGFSRWVSLVYLLIGLIILYTNPILFVNELPDSLYVVVQFVSPGTLVFQAGGVLAAVGLLSLWFWKKPQVEEPDLSEPVKENVIAEDE